MYSTIFSSSFWDACIDQYYYIWYNILIVLFSLYTVQYTHDTEVNENHLHAGTSEQHGARNT